MTIPNIFSALGTKMVALQTADMEEVYIHKSLLKSEGAAFGECGWSCFPSATVANFVEYLYQGDYTLPEALVASSGGSEHTQATNPGTGLHDAPSEIGEDASSTDQETFRKPLGNTDVFLAHARLFILSRHREASPLASMCLKRLNEAMESAQDTTKESMFVENIRALIRFSYNPCCNGNNSAWRELQKIVSEFLVSKKGWLLEVRGSDLLGGEELAKGLFATVIDLLTITDQCLIDKDKIIADTNKSLIDKDKIIADTSRICMEAQRKCEALETELAQRRPIKKKMTGKKKPYYL